MQRTSCADAATGLQSALAAGGEVSALGHKAVCALLAAAGRHSVFVSLLVNRTVRDGRALQQVGSSEYSCD